MREIDWVEVLERIKGAAKVGRRRGQAIDTEDLEQDLALEILERIRKGDKEIQTKLLDGNGAYLRVTARNRAIDRARKAENERKLIASIASDEEDASDDPA